MNCEQIRSNLLAYLDGEVTADERAQIQAHLEACPDCTTELQRLQRLRGDLLDALPAGLEQLRLPRPAEDRIRARLRQAQQGRRGFFGGLAAGLRPRAGLAKAAIASMVALFVVLATVLGTPPARVSAQETVVVAPPTLAPDSDAALRVIVRDRASAQPVAGAEITVRLRPSGEGQPQTLYSGRTDQMGTADVRFRVPYYDQDRLDAELIVHTASILGADEVRQQVTVRRSFRLYLTSDKPLYQPGQTVHLRVLALEATAGLPVAGRALRFLVHDPDGRRLCENTVRASDYGIAAADCALPEAAPYGTYRLVAALGDTFFQRTMTVGRYERPRFRVDLAVVQSYYLPGEVVEGELSAHTLDGAALPAANATLRAYLHDPQRRLVATLQGRTDASGAFAFRFGLPSKLRGEQANLALEASVTDAAGHMEWAGRTLPVAAEALVIRVVAEGGRLRPGVANAVYVLTARPDGSPVQAALEVRVADRLQRLTTNDYGLAQFTLTPPRDTTEVQVQVTAVDPVGQITARTVTLSADRGPAQVLLHADRAVYQVGEVMHLEVLAGQGQVVYLDVVRREEEGSPGQTLSTHVAELRNGRASLEIDVGPQMAGTLELHAYQVLDDGTLVGDVRLAVVDAPEQVKVTIRPDQAAYAPGETAGVTIDTDLDGQEVQSALGIAVVDESVFALEERTPGFAKLFFLLEGSLREAAARPLGVGLPDLLEPPDVEGVRTAQDLAARAAWADLPTSELPVQRSGPPPADTLAAARRRLLGFGWALGVALLGIPLALWATVVVRLRRAGSLRTALRTAALLWVAFPLGAAALAAALGGLSLLAGEQAGQVLTAIAGLACLGALVPLAVHAWGRRDEGAQVVVLLIAAYAILGGLFAYAVGRAGDPNPYLSLAVAVAFLVMLLGLLLLSAGFWVERRRGAAGALLILALCLVAVAVLAATTFLASSYLSGAIADPRLYAGPVSWFTGCAVEPMPSPPAAEKVVKETVIVEKEVEKVVTKVVEKEVEVTKEVEKEVTQVAEEAATPTAIPQPTPTPAATATPTPAPAAAPTATLPPSLEPPPPLLGQFVPETIYWAPEAITGRGGHLEIEIPLPGAPATWRLTVLASTRLGQLGGATATLRAAR